MAEYITEVAVSENEAEEKTLQEKGFKVTQGYLNQKPGGYEIRLWHKEGSSNPLTRIQFSSTVNMAKGLSQAGYQKIDKNLNAGEGQPPIYLWYYHGDTHYDVAIKAFHISTDVADEALSVQNHWEKLACYLNQYSARDNIFLWVMRTKPVYICDIIATSDCESDATYFNEGYIRMDQNTNSPSTQEPVFIWYRQSTEETKETIKDLKISINDEEFQELQDQGYTLVNVNLNLGDPGSVYLWFIRSGSDSIRGITYVPSSAKGQYEKFGAVVVRNSLESQWKKETLYLCSYH